LSETETGVDEPGDDDGAAEPEVGVGVPSAGGGFVADVADVVVDSQSELNKDK
jgi:hypothetical protein